MPLDPVLEKIRKEMERSPEYRAAVERAAQTMFEASIAAQAAEAGVSPEAWTRAASKATLDQARNLADRAAESLIRDFTTAELNSIGEKIARAIEEGKRPRDIAKTLDEVKKLDKTSKPVQNPRRKHASRPAKRPLHWIYRDPDH